MKIHNIKMFLSDTHISLCLQNKNRNIHYAKSVHIPVHSVFLRILSECGKMWTRKTPNTFHAVISSHSCILPFSVYKQKRKS